MYALADRSGVGDAEAIITLTRLLNSSVRHFTRGKVHALEGRGRQPTPARQGPQRAELRLNYVDQTVVIKISNRTLEADRAARVSLQARTHSILPRQLVVSIWHYHHLKNQQEQ